MQHEAILNTTKYCHAAFVAYVKPIADKCKMYIYFDKCWVLGAIGKIIQVNNDRGKM